MLLLLYDRSAQKMRHGVLVNSEEILESNRLNLLDSIHHLDDIMTSLVSEKANYKPLVFLFFLFLYFLIIFFLSFYLFLYRNMDGEMQNTQFILGMLQVNWVPL